MPLSILRTGRGSAPRAGAGLVADPAADAAADPLAGAHLAGGRETGALTGTALPSGGTRINPSDSAARQRAGLPASGKVTGGTRVSGGIGSGIGGRSGTGAGS